MRIALIVLVSLAVGIGTGFGFTVVEFAGVEERFANQAYRPSAAKDEIEVTVMPAHAVVLATDDYNFGTLRRHQRRQHTFVIRNEGEDLLRLEFHSRSCGRCIATRIRTEEVSANQTVEIPVEFHTAKADEDFHEYVELITNDPNRPMLRLSISGKVTERIRMSSSQLRVETVSASDLVSQTFRVFGYHSDELEVLSHEFTDPDTADKFDIGVVPIDVAELEMDPPPVAACEVRVEMKPGMPIGPITQTILLEVKAGESSVLNVPIVGTVISDISVIGPRSFTRSKNLLGIGRVKRDEGSTTKLQIRVRGPEKDNVELRVESTDPEDALRAEIGERVPVSDGAAYMYPLTVSVPKGAALVNRMGSDQGDFARITIATTHPDSRQLLILVQLIVE